MFDLVKLSKLRIAALRNGMIGVGEPNIVNTGFLPGCARDMTIDVMVAVVMAIKSKEEPYAVIEIDDKAYMISVTEVVVTNPNVTVVDGPTEIQ